jgi:hypothetical protein
VRRLAKASSAGSIDDQGSSLGSFLRGVFATRGVAGDSEGRGAPAGRGTRLGSLALLCSAIAAAMALSAAPALAVETHPYTGLSFGPDGTASTSFSAIQSVAVDQASGNVFVYATGEGGKIYKFDAAGNPVNFSGLSGNAIESVGGSFGPENQIAVAPVGSPGGTGGDIYAANNSVVKIYSPSGSFLGELTGGETCGVAVNPAGHVFVGVYPNTVREYVPSANPATNGDETAASTADLPGICSVAADGLGNVYAANYSGSQGTVQLAGLGAASATPFDPSANTLGVDPSNNDVYANRRSEIAQYDSSGALIGTFGAGQISESRGVAVNGAAAEIYVGNGGSGKVDVFGAGIVVPGLTLEPSSGITGSKATLHASVNPDGLAVSECKFEYGATTAYGSSKPCEGAIPADSGDHPVTAALSGLTPNTSYHFRIVATNANGTNQSDDQSFATSQPAVTSSATGVAGTKATLNGIVFPEGEEITECKFEYGLNFTFSNTAPCEGAIPTDEGEHPVTAVLTHLTPNGREYRFRLVISLAGNVVSGSSSGFITKDTVVTGGASAITPPAATIEGTLNPEGSLFAECSFEYGPSVAYGSSVPCVESPAVIGEGSSAVPVHADLSGVSFGSKYHYRLVGTNGDGTVKGTDKSFETPGAMIEAEFASSVVFTEATLKAKINPKGSPTTYHLEYGTSSSYGHNSPEISVGSDEAGHSVTQTLTGLTSGATYHYRFVATNSFGATEGADHTFTTFSPTVPYVSCPNQVFRTGVAADLPDCRAYEMVSPIGKSGADIFSLEDFAEHNTGLDQAAASGGKLTYSSYRSFGNAQGAPYTNQYLATRDPQHGGWLTDNISAPQRGKGTSYYALRGEYKAFSADLSRGWLVHGSPPLAPGAVEKITNFYRRDNLLGEYKTLIPVEPNLEPGEPGYEPEPQGFSADGTKAVFRANGRLTPDATGGIEQAYISNEGALHLVCILPDGTPSNAPCTIGGEGGNLEARGFENLVAGAMSEDGSRVYWSTAAGGGPRTVYLRENPDQEQSAISGGECTEPTKACTIPVSGIVSNESSQYWGATPDGSKAIVEVGDSLYEFDAEARTATLIAGEVPGVLGASADMTELYFVSREALAGSAAAGRLNLYLKDGEGTFFIATLSGEDLSPKGFFHPMGSFTASPSAHTGRVTPDGRHIVFVSTAQITSYDNTDAVSGQSDAEVYTYEAGASGPVCVSCNPSGAAPQGREVDEAINGNVGPWASAAIPPWQTELYGAHSLTDDGSRIFFNSYEAVLPQDTNGAIDVYEWEAVGAGTCSEESASFSPHNQGCVSLISSGESPRDSEFVDSSADGRDVFIRTATSFVAQDPGLIDIYDARVDGGFPPPNGQAKPCEGEACQGTPSPPNDPTPASSAYDGPGNVHKAPVRKKAHKKRHRGKKHKKKQGGKSRRQTTHRNG